MVIPIAVFILLFIAILLLKKRRQGIPLDREERIIAYVGLIIAIILGFLGVIFTINPSFLEPRGVHNSFFRQFVVILPLKKEDSNYKL